jgi:hypothetical protein
MECIDDVFMGLSGLEMAAMACTAVMVVLSTVVAYAGTSFTTYTFELPFGVEAN